MNAVFLFPRLPPRIARSRLEAIKGRPPAELSRLAQEDSSEAEYPATGGARVSPVTLREVRQKLTENAALLGFPDPDRLNTSQFDPETAGILFESLPISAAEASRDDVWSFLTICLLPDLATWRFPDQNDRRFLGGARNTFQRLWWRTAMLRDDRAPDPLRLVRLPEDALVGLMERPGISSNRAVAQSIARRIEALIGALPAALREDGWRAAYKRIRQRIPLVNLEALSDASLEEQLDTLCQAAIAEIRVRRMR